MGYIQKRLSGRAQEERAQKILKLLESSAKGSRTAYEELLETGFTRELARAPLGGDTITKWYWSVTLLDLAGIVDQGRRKFPTQDYRRDWIEAVAGVAEKVAPYAWQTLMQRPTKKLSLSLTKNPFDFEAEANGPSWDPSQTRRPSSPLEDILFKPLRHPLLVGGWVQAIDYMGNQLSPAQAARVSYGSGTNQRSRDLRLLRTLVRDKHTTPLEMLRVGMEVREPKFVSRQIVRHRTLPWCAFMGDLSPEAGPYIPPTDRLSYQSGQEKQGSSGQLPEESQRNVLAVLNSIFDSQAEIVKGLTDLGAPGEIIDRVPGVGHYNRVWRSGDAHNLANFFRLRLDSHAQAEAQAIASILANVAKNHFPKIYQAMENFGWEGISLSQAEIQLLKDSGIIDPHVALPRGLLQYNEIFSVDSRGNPTREVKGLAGKLRRLGIINPLGNLTT
jgi:thymidylate synthase (FAD)